MPYSCTAGCLWCIKIGNYRDVSKLKTLCRKRCRSLAGNNLRTKIIMQPKIEPLLGLKDIIVAFNISKATLFRWLRDARHGKNNFPLPLNTPGRRLVWSKAAIEAFLEKSQPVDCPKAATPRQLKRRHADAMYKLESVHGVKMSSRKEVE